MGMLDSLFAHLGGSFFNAASPDTDDTVCQIPPHVLNAWRANNCQVCYMIGKDKCNQHSPKTYGSPNKDYIDGECEDITDKRSLPKLENE